MLNYSWPCVLVYNQITGADFYILSADPRWRATPICNSQIVALGVSTYDRPGSVILARDAWHLECQQRESLYALQAYTAQLDAYVGGGGDWAADGLDDDEYLDAPGAWHDGEALGDFLGA